MLAAPGTGRDIRTMPVPDPVVAVTPASATDPMATLNITIPPMVQRSPAPSRLSSGPPSPRKVVDRHILPKITRLAGPGGKSKQTQHNK